MFDHMIKRLFSYRPYVNLLVNISPRSDIDAKRLLSKHSVSFFIRILTLLL